MVTIVLAKLSTAQLIPQSFQVLNCHIISSKTNKNLSRNKKDFAKLCRTTRANGFTFTRRIVFVFVFSYNKICFLPVLTNMKFGGRHKEGNPSLKTWAKTIMICAVHMLLMVKDTFFIICIRYI